MVVGVALSVAGSAAGLADESGVAVVESGCVVCSAEGAGIESKIEFEVVYGRPGVKAPGLNLRPLCARALVANRTAVAANASTAERVMRNICATTDSA